MAFRTDYRTRLPHDIVDGASSSGTSAAAVDVDSAQPEAAAQSCLRLSKGAGTKTARAGGGACRSLLWERTRKTKVKQTRGAYPRCRHARHAGPALCARHVHTGFVSDGKSSDDMRRHDAATWHGCHQGHSSYRARQLLKVA